MDGSGTSTPPEEPSAPPFEDIDEVSDIAAATNRESNLEPRPSMSLYPQLPSTSNTMQQINNEFPTHERQPLKQETWVFDERSPTHKCGNLAWFRNFNIGTDGNTISLQEAHRTNTPYGIGDVHGWAKSTHGLNIKFVLRGVQYIPNCQNSVSTDWLAKQKCKVERKRGNIYVETPDGQHTFKSELGLSNQLMVFEPLAADEADTITTKLNLNDNCELWHQRLMHYQRDIFSASEHMFTEITGFTNDGQVACKPCIQKYITTHTAIHLKSNNTTPGTHLQKCDVINVVYLDLEEASLEGQNCVIMFEDKSTSFAWAVPLIKQNLADETFKFFMELSKTLEKLPSGNQRQIFLSESFQKKMSGFKKKLSSCGFKCENQHVDEERKYRDKLTDIFTKTQTILKSVGLPPTLWHRTLDTIVFLENSIVKGSPNETRSSFVKFKNRKPTAANLRIIGSPSWAQGMKPSRDRTYRLCYMLGYNSKKKCFNFWYRTENKQQLCITATKFVSFEEAFLLDLNSTVDRVIRPSPALAGSNCTDRVEFKRIYELLKKIDNSKNTAISSRVKAEANEKFYEDFLDECRREPHVPSNDPEYLKKVKELDKINLPIAEQLENYKLKDKKLETVERYLDENDNGSVFTMISLALFGTPANSTCLRVVFIRHLAKYWKTLEESSLAMFNVKIESVMQSAKDCRISGLEPILQIFSFLLERPIYFTTVEDQPGPNHYTYVFLDNEKLKEKTPIWLVHWNEKLLVRMRKKNCPITGFLPSDAIKWGTYVKKYEDHAPGRKNEFICKGKTDPTRLMLPVVPGHPEYLNQDLYNQARQIMRQTNRVDSNMSGDDKANMAAEGNMDLAGKLVPFVTNLLTELKKRKKILDSTSGTQNTRKRTKKCSTCVDSDNTNNNLKLDLQKLLSENKKLKQENAKMRSQQRHEKQARNEETSGPSSSTRQQSQPSANNEPQPHSSNRGYSGRLRPRTQTATTSNQSTSVQPPVGSWAFDMRNNQEGEEQDQHVPYTYDEYLRKRRAQGKKAMSLDEYLQAFFNQGGFPRRPPEAPERQCPMPGCLKEFIQEDLALRHVQKFHKREIPKSMRRYARANLDASDADFRFACDYCDRTFTTAANLKKHASRYHDPNSKTKGRFECPHCDKIFIGEICRDSHVYLKHELFKKQRDQTDESDQDEEDSDEA